jgi:hypothetical protein
MLKNTPTKKTSKTPKIICGIIIAIFIAVVGYFSIPSFWFWICWIFIGAGLVAIGCIGEWVLFINPLPEKSEARLKAYHRQRELQFITAVAIGVTMDFIGLFHEIPKAMQLENDVVLIGSTNAQLVASNLWLQTKLQPRVIMPDKIKDFIFLTKNVYKIPIKVCALEPRGEAYNYAYQIRQMLNQADFLPPTNCSSIFGIDIIDLRIVKEPGETFEWPSVVLECFSTNKVYILWDSNYEMTTNGYKRPIVTENDPLKIYSAILSVFQQLEIPIGSRGMPSPRKPGEFDFVVCPKTF